MRRDLFLSAIVVWATSSLAMPSFAQSAAETPRVTGQEAAAEAAIILNEVNIDNYPDVRIFATVLRDGQPLTGLTAADFRVREDEVDQEPLVVEPQLPPLSVVVTLDSSGSMSRRMAATQEAAKEFVRSLGDGDSVQLVSFAREIRTLTPMTSTKNAVLQAIDGLTARGDTALYDALHRSLDLLAERRGRRAVVLLSDGVDDDGTGQPLSESTIDDVLDRAAEVGVPIFVVGLGTEMDEAVLSDIAQTTGAQYLNAPDAGELSAIYGQISDQLSGQYAIRYTSSLPADGTPRRVDLAALGQQASKPYTAPGAAAPEAAPGPKPTASVGGCPPMDAVHVERPELEQAYQRYQQNLITSTDRDHVRRTVVGRLEEAFAGKPVDLDCARESLAAVLDIHGANLISSSARDRLRSEMSDQIAAACAASASEDGQVACLRFTQQAYGDNLISSSTRNDLRDDAFERLLASLSETPEFDEDMTMIGRLYSENLITSSHRNRAREVLLAAEQ